MNKFHILSLLCLVGAVVFFFFGFLRGEVESGIAVIVPFISGSGIFGFLGVILFFLSIVFFMFGFAGSVEDRGQYIETHRDTPEKKTSVKGGGVVLVGPIPIVFGSSWKIALVLMVLAIVIIIISLLFFRIV